MADKNFFDQFDPPAQSGVIITKRVTPKDTAETISAQAKAAHAESESAATARIKNAEAAALERKNAEADAEDQATRMRPNGHMTIDQVPASARPIVSALLAGNLPVGARSITSPKMLPYLQMAINIKPDFSAATFAAKANAIKQLSDMKSTGGYLNSLTANIDHSREEESAINGLNNPGGLYGRMGGAALHNWLYNQGGVTGTTFNQANRVFSGEQVKSIVGSAGSGGANTALADRQDAEKAIGMSMPIDAQRAALRTGALQNYQKFQSVDQANMRALGTHIPDPMNQEQAKQLLHLMRLKGDGTEGPIPDNVDPSFIALATGHGGPGIGGGGAVPPGAGGSGGGGGPNTPGGPLATGGTKVERNPKREQALDALLRAGADDATINSTSQALGGMGFDPKELARMRDAVGKGYKGGTFDTSVSAPTTLLNRMAASPVGTALGATADAALGGTSDEIASALGGGDMADLNARKQAAFSQNPKSAFAGQAVGTIGAMSALGGLGKLAGVSRFIPQVAGDIGFGIASGAGQNNDDRLGGGIAGGIGGLGGNLLGAGLSRGVGALARTDTGLAVTNATRGMFGKSNIAPASPLSSGESTVLSAINKSDPTAVRTSLSEARDMGVPMSLADTNPNLTELAGQAVRRSPSAAQIGENALFSRGRGQYDRFTGAVDRNLGPTANIPQLSADLTAQARTAAAPHYDRAYSSPVPGTPELDAVLGTPFGQTAVGRARTIAANERRSPSELGFAQDAQGNTVLNPMPNQAIADHLGARAELDASQEAYRAARNGTGDVNGARQRVEAARDGVRKAEAALSVAPDPSKPASVPGYTTQTLDYVKRGMDDALEEKRNPITGRLVLDEAGRAQNGVRSQLLSEVDRWNPAYQDARQAYAGPMGSRDALARGSDAYSLSPQELAMQVVNQSPEHFGQMQLGYRGAMIDHAGRVRDSSNPWDATLGSPVARQRLDAMYPDNPGVQNLNRQAELEKGMQQTTNSVLGNSRTARNLIADQAFSENPVFETALHAGSAALTGGASLPVSGAMLAGAGMKDRVKGFIGQRAISRANDVAPLVLNTDPSQSLTTMSDLASKQQAWQDFIAATTPKKFGMFGAGAGIAGEQAALRY
jgi:hypothetical protein